jgi:hypothetical protein
MTPTFVYNQQIEAFTMTPSAVTFALSALTLGSSGGTTSPSGNSISSGAYYYLSSFLLDSTQQISGVTGNVSATTGYNLTVSKSHDINPVFSLMTGSTLFTMTPNSNYYLKSLSIDGSNQVSAVTGSVSGVTTYNLQNISTGRSIQALFKAYGQ